MRLVLLHCAMVSATICLAAPAIAAPGAPVQIQVGEALPRFALLKPGVHRYLRYLATGDRRDAIDIWTRRVAFEPHDGQVRLHITQRWDEVGKPLSLTQDSWFDTATFAPLTHVKRVDRDGKIEIGGYRWGPHAVEGMKELADNGRRDFSQAAPEAAYNFEYDMEFLQALPLAAGYQVSIPFYDPGLEPPARYVFKVAGAERIPGPDGRPIDCWLVTADYNTGKVVNRFWFDKKTQVMIREEHVRDDGAVQVKALLPPEAADV